MKNAGKFFKRQGFYLALLGVVCAAGYLSVKGADKATDKASQIKLAREGNRVNEDKKDVLGEEQVEVRSGNVNDVNTDILSGSEKEDKKDEITGLDLEEATDKSGATDKTDEVVEAEERNDNDKNGKTAKVDKAGHDLGVVNVSAIAYSFNQEEGIEWPLEGNILMKFSDEAPVYYETVGSFMVNDGLVIAAHMGDEVKCGCDGVVTNIYKDDMYGNMIDISIGDDYTLTYGQLENVKVNIGDDVKESDVIANVAAPSSFFAKEGENVFVRIRDRDGYIDPLFFLK